MNNKRLADIIAIHLLISVEKAESLVIGIQRGYALNDIDYISALVYRDNVIDKLIKENKILKQQIVVESEL